jgi:predicted secreted protein
MSRWWQVLRPGRAAPSRGWPSTEPAAPPRPTALVSAGRPRGGAPAARRLPDGRAEGSGLGVVVPITLRRQARARILRRDVELGKADHGRTVVARVGEEFLVRLPEDWASGYTWQFTDPVDDLLAVVGSSFEGAAPSRPGRGGHLVIRLRGRRQGSAPLRLVLGRLWGGEPVDAFEVTVRVVEQGDDPHGSPH